MIRIILPAHLRTLSQTGGEGHLDIDGAATVNLIVDALEASYPALRGTVRDPATGRRRPFVRFFASGEDWSHESPDTPLPEAIARGTEPLLIVGAIAGGC